MSQHTILVIGATGTVGPPVARHLREDGYRVRLLVRDPTRAAAQLGSGFEYIQGSVEERETVKQALRGCTGVHISLQAGSHPADIERVEHLGTLRVIELAAQQSLAHLTYMSGMFVGAEAGSAVLDDHAKRRVEQALQHSGIPSTIFKPTYFMDTLPQQLQGKRAMMLGKQPHPLHLVAASDFGRMVSRAFQEPEAANNILEPKARVTTMPLWLMSVVDTLFLGRKMRRTLQIMQILQRSGEVGDPSEANRLLGAPTTTLRAWCEQHGRLVEGEATISAVPEQHPRHLLV